MEQLTLEWSIQSQRYHYIFTHDSPTKISDKLRIGRDPARCDIVFADRSVSSLHVEIFFSATRDAALIQNLRPSNPPLVNGDRLTEGTAPLFQGSQIQLGHIQLRVAQLVLPIQANVPPRVPALSPVATYGLKCPNPTCGKVSKYDDQILKQGCPWCGFSLAAANTVLVASSKG
ncbi:FHA domain-containing protein [Synechococcus moorigangaii CMS01]|nr:FHA domain-containing protein [Synechococcus moorigangaii CMS01]